MRSEDFRYRLVPILLIFATVLSLFFIAAQVSAGGVTSTPGGTTIPVVQGQVFLLRHELYFDEPAYGGVFTFMVGWKVFGRTENFTLENAPSVYWESTGLPVDNVQYDNVGFVWGTGEDGWKVDVMITSDNKVWVDGKFYVDVYLRAASEGAPHSPGDHSLDYGTGIFVREHMPVITSVAPVTIQVLPKAIAHGVDISISPNENSGPPGATLNYTVTVTNTGNIMDNYWLSAVDDAGWLPSVLPPSLMVPPGEDRTATLSVTIPDNATISTRDSITVTASGTTVEDLDSCVAHAAPVSLRMVDVSISPSENSGPPSATLNYTITVTNVGTAVDNYILTVNDNAGWALTLSENLLEVPTGESRIATLGVAIPDDAEPNACDRITVTATSQADPAVNNSAACAAIATGVPPSPHPIPYTVIAGIAIGVGVVVAIALLLKRGVSLPR